MVISSQDMPTLMNAAATDGAVLTNSSNDASVLDSFYMKFYRNGGALNSLSGINTDYENTQVMGQWLENTPVPEQTFGEGYSIKLTTNHYAGKFLLSQPTVWAGKKELINAGPLLLSQSWAKTAEILGHSLLIFGSTAQASVPKVRGVPMVNVLTGDGLTLFNSAHHWRNSTTITNSNTLATYVHPSVAGVNAVNKVTRRWRGADNQPLNCFVDTLLVPVELDLLTQVFKKSDRDPLSANGAANVFNTMVPGGVIVDPYLPSTSAWYALTNQKKQWPQYRELRAPFAVPILLNTTFLFHSGVAMIASRAYGPSVSGWMGIFEVTGSTSGINLTNTLL